MILNGGREESEGKGIEEGNGRAGKWLNDAVEKASAGQWLAVPFVIIG